MCFGRGILTSPFARTADSLLTLWDGKKDKEQSFQKAVDGTLFIAAVVLQTEVSAPRVE